MIGTHCTTVSTDREGYTVVIYHQTQVVKFNSQEIILDTGGYETLTTKRRMNETSDLLNLRFRVYSHKNVMYASYQGKEIPFEGHVLILER